MENCDFFLGSLSLPSLSPEDNNNGKDIKVKVCWDRNESPGVIHALSLIQQKENSGENNDVQVFDNDISNNLKNSAQEVTTLSKEPQRLLVSYYYRNVFLLIFHFQLTQFSFFLTTQSEKCCVMTKTCNISWELLHTLVRLLKSNPSRYGEVISEAENIIWALKGFLNNLPPPKQPKSAVKIRHLKSNSTSRTAKKCNVLAASQIQASQAALKIKKTYFMKKNLTTKASQAAFISAQKITQVLENRRAALEKNKENQQQFNQILLLI